eukprot:6454771-Amphidinium_carterae.1
MKCCCIPFAQDGWNWNVRMITFATLVASLGTIFCLEHHVLVAPRQLNSKPSQPKAPANVAKI